MGKRARGILLGMAAVILAASAAAGLQYRHDLAEARTATASGSQVIDSPWGRIEYADVGSGPVVLMIHGSGGGFDQGLAFSRRLQGRGFRLIVPSRFGYLRSDMPAGATPEMQADALAWLLRRLKVEKAVVFGGSAGALSASQLAIRHPNLCRGLVLGVPALYAPDRAPNTNAAPNPLVQASIDALLGSDLLFWATTRAAPDFMTRMVLATDPELVRRASPAEQKRVKDVLRRVLPVSARQAGLRMDGATAGAPRPYALNTVACPVLAISARDDLYGTAAAARHAVREAPRARLMMFESGGHLWVGHDEELWEAVARFARDPEADPAARVSGSD